MNRKILLATIIPVSLFLVFLGIRNPDLKDNSRPKPRPRAVVENVETSPQKACDAQELDFETGQATPVELPRLGFRLLIQDRFELASRVVEFSDSRAPPFSLAKLS